jgi:hypothetical protein
MVSSDHTASRKLILFERAVCIAAFGLDKADSVPPLFDRSKWRFGWSPEVMAGLRRLVAWLVAQGAQVRAFLDDGRQFNRLRWPRLQEVVEQDRAETIFEAFRLICGEHGLALGLDDPLLFMNSRASQLAGMAKRFMKEVEDIAAIALVDLEGYPTSVQPSQPVQPLQSAQPEQPTQFELETSAQVEVSELQAPAPPEPAPEKPSEPEAQPKPPPETAEPEAQQPEVTKPGAEQVPDEEEGNPSLVKRLMRDARKNERLMRDVRKRWSGEGPDLTYDEMENILRNDHSDLRERKGSLKSSLERAIRNLRNEDEAQRRRASPDSPSDSPSTRDNLSRSPSDGPSTLGDDPSDTPL